MTQDETTTRVAVFMASHAQRGTVWLARRELEAITRRPDGPSWAKVERAVLDLERWGLVSISPSETDVRDDERLVWRGPTNPAPPTTTRSRRHR